MYGTKKRSELRKKELKVNEVSEQAFEIYSNSDLSFYEDRNSNIYINMQDGCCSMVGDLKDLEQLLMEYGEE